MYDYLIVGCGLYGATFAHEALQAGKSCLVIDKRPHIGGNVYTAAMADIQVHQYGAHIFHTSNPEVWAYVQRFAAFNRYTNSPIANYRGRLFNLPFNMNTFYQMWGVKTPAEAQDKIARQQAGSSGAEPQNLEEQAIRLIGRDLYEALVKGYTQKQWGRPCTQLPPFIIKRLPVRYTFDNNYFSDPYQGIPQEGYTALVERMLEGCQVRLNTDYFANREELDALARKTVFTGRVDEYFGYSLGRLQYRSLRFDTQLLDMENYQGVAVMNYTDAETPYTRVIEHKHFAYGTQPKTVVTYEYSLDASQGGEPYYPINDEANNSLYARYRELAQGEDRVIFGGRLGEYRYYDMDQVIASALATARRELGD